MKIVTHLLLFSLLLIYASPNKNPGEWVKLYSLIEHWQYHQTEGAISFWEFLVLHYADNQHHKEDCEHHDKLPFQSHQQAQNSALFIIPSYTIQNISSILLVPTEKPFFYISIHPVNHIIFDIWQPPRF